MISDQKKTPAASTQSVTQSLLQTIDSTVQKHASNILPYKLLAMAKCLDGIDTSFFMNNAKKSLTPLARRIQNNPMSVIELLGDSDDNE